MADTRNPLADMKEILEVTLAERAHLDMKIASLQSAIKILEPIYGDDATGELPDVAELGITDIVRAILRSSARVTPTQIRDGVVATGFSMKKYDNPMAIIHQVLRRLVDAGQAAMFSNDEGKTTYEWIAKPPLRDLISLNMGSVASVFPPVPGTESAQVLREANRVATGKKK